MVSTPLCLLCNQLLTQQVAGRYPLTQGPSQLDVISAIAPLLLEHLASTPTLFEEWVLKISKKRLEAPILKDV